MFTSDSPYTVTRTRLSPRDTGDNGNANHLGSCVRNRSNNGDLVFLHLLGRAGLIV